MGKLALIPAQAAIRTLLRADATLTALTGGAQRVLDGVPDDQAYPYISFGEKTTKPWDTFGADAVDDRLTIYVWSQASGDEEALTIASRVNDLLHGTQLDLASGGFRNVIVLLEYLDTMREPNGRTRRAIARYEIKSEEL